MLNRGLRYLSVVAFMLLVKVSSAQVDSLKVNADKAYMNGAYTEAAALYEKILSQEYLSAEVHYNLANAYFKSGQIAPSILHYERALKLAPNDEDIQFNLKLANLSIKDKVEEIPQLFFVSWWNSILKTFGVDGWAWSAVISIALALLGFLLFRFSNDEGTRRLTFYTALIALGWGLFSIYAAQVNFDRAVNTNRAVVFAATINAKSAPDKNGKDLFVIHEGLTVTVSDSLNGWYRIKLSNGDVGWIPEESVVLI
jgi:tetratricopeptide (TPR) repeat protein